MIHFHKFKRRVLGHSVLLSFLLALLAVPKKALGVNLEPSLELAADLVIAYKFLRETYTSKIELSDDPLTVVVHQARGPFRHLFNQWQFVPTQDGCDIHFELRFDFAVPLLRRIIQPIMGRVVERFVAAFEDRARAIYADEG